MSQPLSENPINFHLSMNVSNIDRSVAFFSRVFGMPPAKHRSDYAKFELQNPPVTFSLEPIPPGERGALNHVGFKFKTTAELVEFQRRLELAGIRSQREDGVECCYAKQTKFWLHDPDGTLWEMYVLDGDLEHRGAGQSAEAVTGETYQQPQTKTPPQPIACSINLTLPVRQQWSHRLGSPLVLPGEITAESLDEINLQGTFNGGNSAGQIGPFLNQVAAALKPGGRVAIHCLTSDRHLSEVPALPGPASVVKAVPCLDSLLDHLEAAGFDAVCLTKYNSRACFTAGEAELRETMLEARKPVAADSELVSVVYKGPFAELKLDNGQTLPRGRRVEVARHELDRLRATPAADSLTILETASTPIACTG